MLAQHLEHSAFWRQPLVIVAALGLPLPRRRFEYRVETIGQCLIGSKDAEVPLVAVGGDHVAKKSPGHPCILGIDCTG